MSQFFDACFPKISPNLGTPKIALDVIKQPTSKKPSLDLKKQLISEEPSIDLKNQAVVVSESKPCLETTIVPGNKSYLETTVVPGNKPCLETTVKEIAPIVIRQPIFPSLKKQAKRKCKSCACTKDFHVANGFDFCYICNLYICEKCKGFKYFVCVCGKDNIKRNCCMACSFAFKAIKCKTCLVVLCKKCGEYNDKENKYYCVVHAKN